MSYSYDAKGNRIKKIGSLGVTSYLVDDNQMYARVALESTASAGTAYIWGNQLIRQIQGGSGNLFDGVNAAYDLFPLQGHLNTSLGALDANGNVVESSLGDAFGQLDASMELKQHHLYTGEYFDQDAQLFYLRARWYDPRIGRFVSADPFEGRQKKPQSLNRYRYAESDPVNKSDPSGLLTLGEIGQVLTVIALATTLQASSPMGRSALGCPSRTTASVVRDILSDLKTEFPQRYGGLSPTITTVPWLRGNAFTIANWVNINGITFGITFDNADLYQLATVVAHEVQHTPQSLYTQIFEMNGISDDNYNPADPHWIIEENAHADVAFIWKKLQLKYADKPCN